MPDPPGTISSPDRGRRAGPGLFSFLCGPLKNVFQRGAWPRPELTAVGLAMRAWQGPGQYDGLDGELLHSYLTRKPKAAQLTAVVQDGSLVASRKSSESFLFCFLKVR